MTDLPSLSIVIAATGPRIDRVVLPAPTPGVEILVCVQQDTGLRPEKLLRPDVSILPQAGLGLSHNRNAGLAQAQADLVLFSDDDIDLDPRGIDQLRACFQTDPDLTLALAWRQGARPAKGQRAGVYALNRLNTGHACVPGFMVRRIAIKRAHLRFDPQFGVGTPTPLGEDYIFITDVLRAGLKGRGFPIETGAHPHASSGEDWQNPILMQARREVLARVFGHWHGLVRLAYTLKHRKRFPSVWAALRFAIGV